MLQKQTKNQTTSSQISGINIPNVTFYASLKMKKIKEAAKNGKPIKVGPTTELYQDDDPNKPTVGERTFHVG